MVDQRTSPDTSNFWTLDPYDQITIAHKSLKSPGSEKEMATWCIIKFSSGATEIVPNTWVEGDKVFWPPYPPKDSIRLNAAILKRVQPRNGWHTYPIRLLITRDTHDEAARCLERYVNQNCDTTDIQSEGESHHGLKRKRRPNTIYDSDEPQDVSRFAQAPKVLFPDKPATQQASQTANHHLQRSIIASNAPISLSQLTPMSLSQHRSQEMNWPTLHSVQCLNSRGHLLKILQALPEWH
ncbi:unnamed protein product [Arctogadus glacialis]